MFNIITPTIDPTVIKVHISAVNLTWWLNLWTSVYNAS